MIVVPCGIGRGFAHAAGERAEGLVVPRKPRLYRLPDLSVDIAQRRREARFEFGGPRRQTPVDLGRGLGEGLAQLQQADGEPLIGVVEQPLQGAVVGLR